VADSNQLLYTFTYTGSLSDSLIWTINGQPVAGNDTTLHYLFPGPGNYEVCVNALNNCGGTDTFCSQVTVDSSLGMATFGNLSNIDVFPIPTRSAVILKVKDASMLPLDTELIDMYGNVLIRCRINQPEAKLDMDKLASGNYFLKLSKPGYLKMVRVVKL
jgi:hypothetical protein